MFPPSRSSQEPLQAKEGVTALAGQVLALTGRPLEGVTLQIGTKTAKTDRQGRFLLQPLQPGLQTLTIDGRGANQGQRQYGVFVSGIDLVAGKTTILPHTIWLVPLDTKHTVTFDAPTKEEIVLTTPAIPGLEVRIPAGSIVKDQQGRVVTELGITAIPLDKSPFPLPLGQTIPPIFFTVQAGGGGAIAALSPGARIVYPNYTALAPGTRADFRQYEPGVHGWEVYGQGAVSADGTQVVPDAGVQVTALYGAMFGTGRTPPGWWPWPGWWPFGDPVDPASGLFVSDKVDLALPDTLPLILARIYQPGNTNSGPYGVGTTQPYETYIWSANQYQETDLILPDGGRVHYVRVSPGTGWTDAVFEAQTTNTRYLKSRIVWNGDGWDLTLRDGTVLVQAENAPLRAIRDRYGNQITITRTDGRSGNIVQLTTSNGKWIAFRYDGGNRIIQATDNTGRTVGYEYDATGHLITVTGPTGGTTRYTYDANGRMTTQQDARGIVFLTNEYDANGRVTKQTQADGSTYHFAYTVDGNGRVTQADLTDPRGTVRRVTFNATGATLTDTVGYGTSFAQTTTYVRQAGTDLPLSVTDPTGRTTTYTYDANGNVLTVTRLAGTPAAITATLTYGPFDQVASATDPLGIAATYDYDTQGRLTRIHGPLGRTSGFTYNGAGQVLTATDALGHTTTYTYSHGDLVAVADPLGRQTTHLVDGAGRLLSVTDPLGHVARYAYDPLNRLMSITDPRGGVSSFGYDQNGNRLTLTDARNQTTTYTYDPMDQVTSRKDPLGHSETDGYDPGGLPTTATDRKGQATATAYDVLGRATLVTYQDGSTIGYTYDGADRVTQVADSTSGTITYFYDALDRVTQETTPRGATLYAYDNGGRLRTLTVQGQAAITYQYDDAGRTTSVTQGAATTTYGYDLGDRRTTMTSPNGIAATFTYDDADQLTGITYTRGAATVGTLTYAYDGAGRKISLGGTLARVALPAATTATASYNANNQLVSWNGATLTYDRNGALTGDGTNTYTWDARGQLTGIGGGTTASFAYDATGRRVGRTVGGTATALLNAGDTVVQEQRNGAPVAHCIPGAGIDQFASRTDAGGARTPLTDALGSVLALVDDAGAIRTEYTYGPFGATTASGQASDNASQFTGRDNDGTGLYYYRARYYSPALQRFISEDPAGFAAGDVNLYAYVGNDPTDAIDPSGMFVQFAVGCAAGGLSNLAVDAAASYFEGRKMSSGDMLKSLGGGCLLGMAGVGFEKIIGKALETLAPHLGELAEAAAKVCGRNSFSADTLVAMADGTSKPIADVRVGDMVLAYDEDTGQVGGRRVTDLIRHDDPGVLEPTLGGERLTTTVAHPFYTRERGWVEAGQLQAGDHVRTANGWYGAVQGKSLRPSPQRLYNLTVDEDHTFFVGAERWLVHNDCWSGTGVRNAAKELFSGADEATVSSRAEAEELFFRLYQGGGYRNTTGLSPSEAKDLFGGKPGTYHWDTTDLHSPNNPHGKGPHVQIHTWDGPIIWIFYK